MPLTTDIDRLVEAARAGRPRAVARLVSLIENSSPALREVMAALTPSTGRATVIGLTGSPGVGKSTTTTALVAALRERGERVGVLAVDPSSPFSGGALLGDRVRMQQHALDPEVFIRSMATRGHLGGLSAAAPQALRVFDAARCDTVVVETVGVGQSEVEVAGLADVTVVLVAPGMGDGIQAAKAGILEVGDLFVVNKADREGAQAVVRDLRTMVAMAAREPHEWKPPVLTTIASVGAGIPELVEAIGRFVDHTREDGSWDRRRTARAAHEIEALALGELRSRFRFGGHAGLPALARAVRDGRLDPYAASDQLVAQATDADIAPDIGVGPDDRSGPLLADRA
ncbi:MAG TPA: methylmalonyl Co-A mutase-associated GTPase MeaB [Microlunatus sp.]|nr:methylmalonyl Co-A mutase-associated GTPase MeaB [Microlunatus sp.]